MEIHPITDTDLNSVASVHMLAFPDSVLTQFGVEAVRRYYSWQLDGPYDSFCIGAFVSTQLAGFCVAGVFRSSETGFLLNNKAYFMWRFLSHPWLLTNKRVQNRMNEIIQSLKIYPVLKREPIDPPAPLPRKFGILSIAVHPQYQGLGIGRSLVLDVEASAHQKGFSSMRLSVHPYNHGAILFYEKLGWRKILGADGIWLGYMAKELGNNNDEFVK